MSRGISAFTMRQPDYDPEWPGTQWWHWLVGFAGMGLFGVFLIWRSRDDPGTIVKMSAVFACGWIVLFVAIAIAAVA